MDFAEDYRCRSQKKIQSTYWSPTQVTMHLVVMYYKKLSKNRNHQNFVFISNKSRHGVTFVFTLIVKLILLLREIVPDLEMIHSTDSPVNIEAKLLPRWSVAMRSFSVAKHQGIMWKLVTERCHGTLLEEGQSVRRTNQLKIASILFRMLLIFMNCQNKILVWLSLYICL